MGLRPLIEKNLAYFKIIKEFREKLPRHQNQAQRLNKEEIIKNEIIPDSFQHISVLNLATHEIHVSESEIDLFYNRLNDFNYSFVLFKNYYKSFTQELNRFNPKSINKNFDIVIVQELLKDNPIHPLKFKDVFIYHIKWKWRLTSFYFKWQVRRKHKSNVNIKKHNEIRRL